MVTGQVRQRDLRRERAPVLAHGVGERLVDHDEVTGDGVVVDLFLVVAVAPPDGQFPALGKPPVDLAECGIAGGLVHLAVPVRGPAVGRGRTVAGQHIVVEALRSVGFLGEKPQPRDVVDRLAQPRYPAQFLGELFGAVQDVIVDLVEQRRQGRNGRPGGIHVPVRFVFPVRRDRNQFSSRGTPVQLHAQTPGFPLCIAVNGARRSNPRPALRTGRQSCPVRWRPRMRDLPVGPWRSGFAPCLRHPAG